VKENEGRGWVARIFGKRKRVQLAVENRKAWARGSELKEVLL
jgi:hypothetical protein